jgi:ribosomal-protein-serine acetyltransferase
VFVYKIDNKVALRLVEVRDAEEIFALTDVSREYLRQWLPWVDSTKEVNDTKSWIKAARKSYAENEGMTTVILYKEKIAGVAGFNSIDWTNKIAYIGYWLAENNQGNGIMTKVSKSLTDYAINELKLNRVDIRAAAENKKSRAIPERIGFVKEGRIRQAEMLNDHYVDHIVYGMLAEDWKK